MLSDVVNAPLTVFFLPVRLHDSTDYPWRPTLTHSEFQKLLHNLTSIKIRGTYSERSMRSLFHLTSFHYVNHAYILVQGLFS